MAVKEKLPMTDDGDETLEGSIEAIIYANDENGYSICDMATSDDEIITIVGTMPFISTAIRSITC